MAGGCGPLLLHLILRRRQNEIDRGFGARQILRAPGGDRIYRREDAGASGGIHGAVQKQGIQGVQELTGAGGIGGQTRVGCEIDRGAGADLLATNTKELTKLARTSVVAVVCKLEFRARARFVPGMLNVGGKKLKTLGESSGASLMPVALLTGAAPSEVAPKARRMLAMKRIGSRKWPSRGIGGRRIIAAARLRDRAGWPQSPPADRRAVPSQRSRRRPRMCRWKKRWRRA